MFNDPSKYNDTDADREVPPDRVRLFSTLVETNNATHIQQVVLALIDRGFDVATEWHSDGCYITVYWRDRVLEESGGVMYVDSMHAGPDGEGGEREQDAFLSPTGEDGDVEFSPIEGLEGEETNAGGGEFRSPAESDDEGDEENE